MVFCARLASGARRACPLGLPPSRGLSLPMVHIRCVTVIATRGNLMLMLRQWCRIWVFLVVVVPSSRCLATCFPLGDSWLTPYLAPLEILVPWEGGWEAWIGLEILGVLGTRSVVGTRRGLVLMVVMLLRTLLSSESCCEACASVGYNWGDPPFGILVPWESVREPHGSVCESVVESRGVLRCRSVWVLFVTSCGRGWAWVWRGVGAALLIVAGLHVDARCHFVWVVLVVLCACGRVAALVF